ncbi:MAG TPA: hypothetical protein VF301_08375 [Ginsengibacter sp.]
MRKTLWLSSCLIFLSATVATLIGICKSYLYNDNDFVRTAWLANDWITLIIVIPAFLIAMFFLKRQGMKAELVWLGLLNYFLYNYAFYLFGAVFNSMFLLYVLICFLSFFSMLGFFSILQISNISFDAKTTKWITFFLLLLSVMLCLIEIPPCIQFISDSKIPELNLKTGLHTNVVYALDLTFIVPCMVIASVLNLKKNIWGGVISVIMLVKASTYGLVLISGTILLMQKGQTDPLLPVWIFIAAGGIFGLYFMLKNSVTKQSTRAFA